MRAGRSTFTSGAAAGLVFVAPWSRTCWATEARVATLVLLGSQTRRPSELAPVVGHVLGLAVGAAVVGWVVQVVAVAAGLRIASEPGQDLLDYPELVDLGADPDEPWEEHLGRLVTLKQRGELLRRGRRAVDSAGAVGDTEHGG